MKKVYAVTSGEYSDYKINAIFSTEKKAKAFKEAVYCDDIEEYELNPPTADLLNRGYSVWFILMLRDGTVESVEKRDGSYATLLNYRIWERTKAGAYKGKGIPDALESYVLAKSEEHAIKIVNEYRTQVIAEGKWN